MITTLYRLYCIFSKSLILHISMYIDIGGPVNLKATVLSSSNVSLKWDPPPVCPDQVYQYEILGVPGFLMLTKLNIKLSGLTSYTNYSVSVSASYLLHDHTAESQPITVTTLLAGEIRM